MARRISQLPKGRPLTGKEWVEAIQRGPEGFWTNVRFKLTDLIPTDTDANIGLVTASQVPVDHEGKAELPSKPLGGFLLDMAHVFLSDGSMVEMTELTHLEQSGKHFVQLKQEDFLDYSEEVETLTVSFIAGLE